MTTLQHFLQTNSRMLKFFTIAFPIEMKPSKSPGKEKKSWATKSKKIGKKKRKVKVEGVVSLSAHACSSKSVI